MKRIFFCLSTGLLLLCSCNKTIDQIIGNKVLKQDSDKFTLYTIKQGEHYTSGNNYKAVDLSELKFIVRFDSSAIYQNKAAINQYDINKLYGFSDNNQDHHQYSARFGWSWTENALRLYAYVYNEGTVMKEEIGTAAIGSDINCSIKVTSDSYLFSMNDAKVSIARKSVTAKAKGYMLYPYFGGDETAPHDIRIWIKNL